MPKNCLFSKQLPKMTIFFKRQVFGNFLIFKWQFFGKIGKAECKTFLLMMSLQLKRSKSENDSSYLNQKQRQTTRIHFFSVHVRQHMGEKVSLFRWSNYEEFLKKVKLYNIISNIQQSSIMKIKETRRSR